HLQLSGHTHKGQIFPFNFITKIVHQGHDYGLYTHGDYTLYTTSGIGTWGPSMRLGNRPEIVAITLR
ncbi:MAG: metallophosphoesterase, partial [Candidatus Moraniibacteriota bacterium]